MNSPPLPPSVPADNVDSAAGDEHRDVAGLQLATLRTVLDHMDVLAVAELERALRLKLAPQASHAQAREATFGPLSELLGTEGVMVGSPEDWPGVPVVSRRRYDELGLEPSSARLVERCGSWLWACRAAHSQTGDAARRHIPSRRRRPPGFGRHRWDDHTCLAWLRRCAHELGYPPTADDFTRWRRAHLQVPGNQQTRVPCVATIARRWGGGSWPAANARVGVTEVQLAEARAARLPAPAPAPATVAARLRLLDDSALEDLGLTRTQARKLAGLQTRKALTLTAACELACALGGSLDWLAGNTEHPGEPPGEGVGVDGDEIRRLMKQMRVSEAVARSAAGMTLGEWRRMLTGKREPMLGEIAAVAGVLRESISRCATHAAQTSE